MSHSILNAWATLKAGASIEEEHYDLSDHGIREVLAPRRLDVLQHFMSKPAATFEQRSFETGVPPVRLQEMIDSLVRSGFLEEGLFGLMAAPGLRETK